MHNKTKRKIKMAIIYCSITLAFILTILFIIYKVNNKAINSSSNNTIDDNSLLDNSSKDNTIDITNNSNTINSTDNKPIDSSNQSNSNNEIPSSSSEPDNNDNPEAITPVADDNPEDESPKYQFGDKLPETEAVEDDYFDDAVFIGNSQIEGILVYTAMQNTTVYAGKGIMVDTIFTKKAIKIADGSRITIMEALAKNQFAKVYILLGANELGWAYDDLFIEQYGKVVDEIKSLQPNAIIYISAIMPVSKEKSESDNIYNNTNIIKYNSLIQEMTKQKEVYYLDSNEALRDDEGNLPMDAGKDGIHLNSIYYNKWFSYLKKHTIKLD